VWVWWYGVAGGLLWLAVIFLWHRTGDFEWAADLICRGGASLGSANFLTGAMLISFALSCALLVIVAPIMAVSRIVERRRAKRHRAELP
jgi:hypothetical protein